MADPKGLSARMSSNIVAILPKIAATIAERPSTRPAKIELSTAENWSLRRELLILCKDPFLGISRWTDPALLDALAPFFNSYFHPSILVSPCQITATVRASSCLDSLLCCTSDPGDAVLVSGPYWNGFDFHFRIRINVNIIVVNLPTFDLTLTSALLPALASAFSSAPNSNRIKALVLTNPQNPFGKCYPADVLLECVRFCCARTIHFVSDEVYAMSEFAN
ncbi:hypothetical protein MMC29_005449 [Sticta canariensis]|nr:hypothetical protein [Sticta canariensis]